MSLQAEIQKRRKMLHATDTLVTTPTGERYIEKHGTGKQKPLAQRSYGFVVDTKPDTQAVCILEDFLYLGSQDAVSVENVLEHKLTHILSVGIETPTTLTAAHKVQKIFLPCLDLPETQLFTAEGTGVVQQAVKAIDDVLKETSNQARILVHCNAGVSRSASVVIGYLMLRRNMSFEQAYDLVKQKRPAIQPNVGFMQQMRSFLNCK